MFLFLYNLILEALFPSSKAEKSVLSYSPEEAWGKLPRAPETPLSNTYAVFAYKNDEVKQLVLGVKYRRLKQAVEIAGFALDRKIKEEITDTDLKNIALIPIPITKKRRNERGFNQSELMAEEIVKLNEGTQININLEKEMDHHLKKDTHKSKQVFL